MNQVLALQAKTEKTHAANYAGTKSEMESASQLRDLGSYVVCAAIEHRKYETGLGNKLMSDIHLVVRFRGRNLVVFVENKSQRKSGSAIEKILDRLERMEAVSFFYQIPVVMILDVRNQNRDVLNRLESGARERHVGLIYRQDLTKLKLQAVVREQMHFLALHADAKAALLAEQTADASTFTPLPRGSELGAIATQYFLYQRRAAFQGRCKEESFVQ